MSLHHSRRGVRGLITKVDKLTNGNGAVAALQPRGNLAGDVQLVAGSF
jgi:hypothetical protein